MPVLRFIEDISHGRRRDVLMPSSFLKMRCAPLVSLAGVRSASVARRSGASMAPAGISWPLLVRVGDTSGRRVYVPPLHGSRAYIRYR